MYSTSRPRWRRATKSCSLSAGTQRRSASPWSRRSGVRIRATRRSGDWRQSDAIPSSLKGSPRRAIRSYSGPESVFAHALTWLAVPPSQTAAPNRSGAAPISQLTMNPPYESPMIPSRAGSARPEVDDVVDCREDVVGVDAAEVAELGRDPCLPVPGPTPDVRQDDPVAARREKDVLQRGCRGPGPDRTPVDVHHRGQGLVERARGRDDPGLDRAAGAGHLDAPHLRPREAAPPGAAEGGVAPDAGAAAGAAGSPAADRPGLATAASRDPATVSSSIGRSSSVATNDTTPPATPSVTAAISASVRRVGAPTGRPASRIPAEAPGLHAAGRADEGHERPGAVPRRPRPR